MTPYPLIAALALAMSTPAQMQRLFVNGLPTNARFDWSTIATIPSNNYPNSFLALTPFSSGAALPWAAWDSPWVMDFVYGPGNWTMCTMTAEAWAYLTPDPCAHQAAPGNAAPLSQLMSAVDFGTYPGFPGLPFLPDSTLFLGGSPSVNTMGSLPGMALHRWVLNTHGYMANLDPWNACPGSVISGWLVARFSYSFQ